MHMRCFYSFTHEHDLSTQNLLKFVPVIPKEMMLHCSSMTTNIHGVLREEHMYGILYIKARYLNKRVCVEILQHPFMLIGQLKPSVSISILYKSMMFCRAIGMMLAPRLVLDSVHGSTQGKICPGSTSQMEKGIIALTTLILLDPINGQTFKTIHFVSVQTPVAHPTAIRMEI